MKKILNNTSLWRHSKVCGQSEDQIHLLKRFICEHCNYNTNLKGHLVRHIKAKYLPRDPNEHKCGKCKKSFSFRSS